MLNSNSVLNTGVLSEHYNPRHIGSDVVSPKVIFSQLHNTNHATNTGQGCRRYCCYKNRSKFPTSKPSSSCLPLNHLSLNVTAGYIAPKKSALACISDKGNKVIVARAAGRGVAAFPLPVAALRPWPQWSCLKSRPGQQCTTFLGLRNSGVQW